MTEFPTLFLTQNAIKIKRRFVHLCFQKLIIESNFWY
jgi:hypothetical protein